MESWRLRELAAQPGCPIPVRDALREAADELVALRQQLAGAVPLDEYMDVLQLLNACRRSYVPGGGEFANDIDRVLSNYGKDGEGAE